MLGVVYEFTNMANGKIYVGVTKRKAEIREYEHRLDFKKGSGRNKDLLNDYSIFGETNFKFEVIIESNEYLIIELVLIELFSRIEIGYKQQRGKCLNKVLKDEIIIPENVYEVIEEYVHRKFINKPCYHDLLYEIDDMRIGFQCKTYNFYNSEFINEFLVSRYKDTTASKVRILFEHACEFEKELNKNLYDFTLEEAEEFLISLRAKTVSSIQNLVSKLNKYLEFAIKEGVSINIHNYYKELGKRENAKKYLYHPKKHNKDKKSRHDKDIENDDDNLSLT